jgi:membrane dipeptidase
MPPPGRRSLVVFLLCASHSFSCSKPASEHSPSAASPPAAPPPPEPITPPPPPPTSDPAERARQLSQRLIIVDGHIDVPYRLRASSNAGQLTEDVSVATTAGDFDYPRAKLGGLDAPFMSIYVPVTYQATGGARTLAEGLIDMVEKIALDHPDKFALAPTPEAVRRNSEAGKISLPLGIENGAALEGRLENVAHFRARGVSYITLTHSRDNDIGDSSYENLETHKGLSAFGKQVVAEMNRVGVMIDVSHVSDATFFQAVEQSQTPVIASHSSLRHFVPGFQRNVSDSMLEALASRGGIVMVNFGSGFLLPKASEVSMKRRQAAAAFAEKHGLNREKQEDRRRIDEHLSATLPMPYARVEDVADHIDRIKQRVGIDHVGLGSDFDGVGDSLPVGLKDVSQYPNLLRVLIERGYTEPELEQLCSGNVLRVWQRALDFAKAASASAPAPSGSAPAEVTPPAK